MMKDSGARMLLVDPHTEKGMRGVLVRDFEDILKALDCRVFSCHVIAIEGYLICAYYDDEELLIDRDHRPIMFDKNKEPLVYGRVLLGMLDYEGNDVSLSFDAFTAIMDNAVLVANRSRTVKYYAIGGVVW